MSFLQSNFKFQAHPAIIALNASPAAPFRKHLAIRKSDFGCPMTGSIDALARQIFRFFRL